MRSLKLTVPAAVLVAWLASSVAQEGAPPAGTPPAAGPPPAGTAPPAGTRQPAPPAEERPEPAPRAGEEEDDTFIPTEELQPDAAVTFPVDI
jgi:hypothetical protein